MDGPCYLCTGGPACPGLADRQHCLDRHERRHPSPDRDAIAARRLTILACDYRVDATGLERGPDCGCTPATRCLLGRGKWPDDRGMVDYGDCLSCTGGG